MKMFTIILASILAFPQYPVFTHLTTEDGLSQNAVLTIVQDAQHNMWFKTQDEYEKYDGYHFCSYTINTPVTRIERFPDLPQLFTDPQGGVYAYTEGIFRYDPASDKFLEVEPERSAALLDSLREINSSRDGALKKVLPGKLLDNVGEVRDMTQTDDMMWFATSEGGVIAAGKTERGEIMQWTMHSGGRAICSNNVRSVCYDRQGHVWAGTGNGLSVIDVRDFSVVNINHSAGHPESLSNNMVKNIYIDDAGGVWVASFYGGVDYYHPKPISFSSVRTGLGEEVIGDITEDSKGRLWIGTGRNGICCYDPKNGKSSKMNLYRNRPEYDDVKAIVFSRDGKKVYVGAGLGGVVVLDYATGKVLSLADKSCPKDVYSILEEDDRYIWVGSLNGLFLYDTHTGKATEVNLLGKRRLVVFDIERNPSNGDLLIGSANALVTCRVRSEGGVPTVTEFSINDKVILIQDVLVSGNDIWLATRKGLYRMQQNGTSLGNPEEFAGLSSKVVRGLECDSEGNIWVGTENGLCCISSKDGRVSRYNKSDGLVTNSFSLYAHTIASDGRIYFGGVGGLVSFFPQSETVDSLSRKPRVCSVLIDGQPINDWNNGIVLSSGQKVMDMYFSVPNYSSARRNVFRYRLKGSSDVWSTAGPSAQVSYSSLRPGRYVFELASENAYGVPCEEICTFPIRVRPPFYLSAAAIVMYLTIAIALIIFLLLHLTRKVAKDKDVEIRRLTVRQYTDRSLSKTEEEFLLKVLQIVSDNISDETFNVEKLSSILCMTRGNLHIKIKKITGDSAIKFIQKVRFGKACELLKQTDLPIAKIGEMVGFTSPAYFTSSFKHFVGMLPGKYRE